MFCFIEYISILPGVIAIIAALVGYGVLKEKVRNNERLIEGRKDFCEKWRMSCQKSMKDVFNEIKRSIETQISNLSHISESVVRIETKLEIIHNENNKNRKHQQ